MIEWITDYINYVDERPQDFNENIKNNTRLIQSLLRKPEIEYKDSDPNAFVKLCRLFHHREGQWAGKPIELNKEQLYFSACVLGIKYYDPNSKRWLRWFKEADLFVARKWGKDTFIAPLVAFLTGFDKEPSAWTQILGENSKQSSRTYDLIKNAIKDRPLSDIFYSRLIPPAIHCKINDGKIEYLSGRSKGKDGSNPSCVVVNEAHEITNFNQYNSMKTAMNARLQPLMIVISSAGTTPESLYETLYERNRKFLSKRSAGEHDRIFALMYGIDDKDKVEDDTKWIKANPAMYEGRPTLQVLRDEWAAVKDNIVLRNTFIAKQLNRELGAALDFFDILSIKDCMKSLKKEDYFDTYAVGGVDLAETTDLCNATAMILKPNGKMLILQAYFMAEQRIAKNSAHDREDYKLYENMATDDIVTSQILIPTPGDYVAKEYVTKWFEMLRDEYKINFLKIGYDPWGAKEWLTDMYNNGFSIEQVKSDKESHVTARDDGIMTEVRQGSFTLSEAIKIVKTLFDDQKIVYDKNNKLLPYCFYNLKLHADSNNNLSPQKSKSRGHIDGAMGIFDAFVGYQRAKALEEYSVLVDYFKI